MYNRLKKYLKAQESFDKLSTYSMTKWMFFLLTAKKNNPQNEDIIYKNQQMAFCFFINFTLL